MNDIKIIEYKSEDKKMLVETIAELEDYAGLLDPWKLSYRGNNSKKLSIPKILDKFNNKLGKIFFAEVGGQKVGLIVGVIEFSTQSENVKNSTKYGKILEIFVETEFQNLGVGRKLIEYVESYFKENRCAMIQVEMASPNLAANRFYGNIGFQKSGFEFVKKVV